MCIIHKSGDERAVDIPIAAGQPLLLRGHAISPDVKLSHPRAEVHANVVIDECPASTHTPVTITPASKNSSHQVLPRSCCCSDRY